MTQTTEVGFVRVGDEIRHGEPYPGPFVTVIERESFKHGTRIWLRLSDGSEHTFCAGNLLSHRRSE
jgi:hypothetical protein